MFNNFFNINNNVTIEDGKRAATYFVIAIIIILCFIPYVWWSESNNKGNREELASIIKDYNNKTKVVNLTNDMSLKINSNGTTTATATNTINRTDKDFNNIDLIDLTNVIGIYKDVKVFKYTKDKINPKELDANGNNKTTIHYNYYFKEENINEINDVPFIKERNTNYADFNNNIKCKNIGCTNINGDKLIKNLAKTRINIDSKNFKTITGNDSNNPNAITSLNNEIDNSNLNDLVDSGTYKIEYKYYILYETEAVDISFLSDSNNNYDFCNLKISGVCPKYIPGKKDDVLSSITGLKKNTSTMEKWITRIVASIVLMIGLHMLIEPIRVAVYGGSNIIEQIPILNIITPFVNLFGGFVLGLYDKLSIVFSVIITIIVYILMWLLVNYKLYIFGALAIGIGISFSKKILDKKQI